MRSSTSSESPKRRRRVVPRPLIALFAACLAVICAVTAFVANAAVPTFPDNLVVFPDRDFIAVEGFQDHVGDVATVEIRRGGTIVGSARSVVAQGDVAFEINHPGGVCWGNDTTHKVTPDIRPGDVAVIRFPDGSSKDTTVADAHASRAVQNRSTITVSGHVGTGVNRDFMEQRIINPDLVDTVVGRRDVRAVPGPMTPAPKGGYSSSLEFPTEDTFLATYEFTDEAAADLAAVAGGERAMVWQEQDADGNRQGLSIAEFGELGGPGMGGCPAGPADQGAPGGTAAALRSADRTSVKVTWTPTESAPGAAAVTGYSAEALARTMSATMDQRAGRTRRTSAGATTTTITGLDPAEEYDVEVRSLAGPRMSEPFKIQSSGATPPPDAVAPKLVVSPAPTDETVLIDEVTLDSTPSRAQLYYTTDGSPVIEAGLPSEQAKLYTGPIAITEPTTLHLMAIDHAGYYDLAVGRYAPPTAVEPDPPTGLSATVGQERLTLKWTSSDESITGYGVQLYDADGPVGPERPTADKTLTVTDLTPGTAYRFAVRAKNGAGFGDASQLSAAYTPEVKSDQVTIASARWKAGDFRILGTASEVGKTVRVRTGSASGPIIGSATVTAAVAPETGGEWSIRLRNNAAGQNPTRIWVTSTGGGVAGPFAVTAN